MPINISNVNLHPLFLEKLLYRFRICKLLRSPEIDSDKSIPPVYVAWRAGITNRVLRTGPLGWESIPGLLKMFTNTGSARAISSCDFMKDDMRRAREYGEMECLPFQTFGDVLSDSLQRRSNILMNPINAFFNKTEEIFAPLKQVLQS